MALFTFGSRSRQPNRLGSIQVSTSEYGVVVPYGAGTFKAPIKLLDYTDFSAVKRDAGGKGGGGNYSYEYYAAVDAVLCKGPSAGLGNIFDGGGAAELFGSTIYATIAGTYQVQHGNKAFYYDEGCTVSASYTYTANDYGSDGPVTVTGVHQVPMQKLPYGATPLTGQYTVKTSGGSEGTYTFSSADAGKGVLITYAYTTADTTDVHARSPMERLSLGFIGGSRPGAAWGYMQTHHPERALSYPGLTRITATSMDLGSSATTPSLSAEVLNCRGLAFGAGIADCDPAAVIRDILTDVVDGCNWQYLGDLTAYSNFCVANNLFISPFYDSQRKATDVVKEICEITNSSPVWSGSALNIVPFGDTTAVANGRTYTPATQPIYQVDLRDIVSKPGQEPVKTSWDGLADCYNRVQLDYTRRDDNYNTDTLRAQDEASIAMNGLLPMQSIAAHHYCVKNYAAVAMDMLLKRNAVPLRRFEFKLKWFFQLLEPMDIILLKGGCAGPYDLPMRIQSIDEQEDYTLDVVAEDFVYGTGRGVLYPRGDGGGNGPGSHDSPGNTNMLAAFQPNTRLTAGVSALWLALAGGAAWGGCRVWLSLDGSSYSVIGRQYGSARSGILTSGLASAADPDDTSTASVSVSGSLQSVSATEADALATISLVGSELIAYRTATLTGSTSSTDSYDLTHLRRGVFSSTAQAHSAGELFVRLDSSIFQYPLDPTLVGKTIFLKFTSLNLYGLEEQNLADVAAKSIVLAARSTAVTMAVGSYLNTGGTSATVTVFLPGGAAGASGTATLANGATVTLPAQTYASQAPSTFYAVNYNPSTAAYVIYTDRNAWLAAQGLGMIGIGTTTTPSAASAGSFAFTSYSDVGASPTDSPAGAYTSGQSATVNSSATYGGSIGGTMSADPQSANGLCSWAGVSGVLASAKTLSVTAAVGITRSGSSGSSHSSISYTLDGSTWTALFNTSVNLSSSTYTVTVPSGTNLANVQVQVASYCTIPGTGTASTSITAATTVSALTIS